MRALALRLGATPMSLYHHVKDRTGLLRALSDRVCAEVLAEAGESVNPWMEIQAILLPYTDPLN